MALLQDALEFATRAHEGQERAGGAPYIEHPKAVVQVLIDHGYGADLHLLAAAYLHDVIEDTGRSKLDLVGIFPEEVISLVLEVTFVPGNYRLWGKEHKELLRRHYTRMTPRAVALKLADRIHNMRDSRATRKASSTRRYAENTRWMLQSLSGADENLLRTLEVELAESAMLEA